MILTCETGISANPSYRWINLSWRPHISEDINRLATAAEESVRSFRQQIEECAHSWRQVMSTCTGISFLTGMVNRVGGWILKSDRVAGIVPLIRASFPWLIT